MFGDMPIWHLRYNIIYVLQGEWLFGLGLFIISLLPMSFEAFDFNASKK